MFELCFVVLCVCVFVGVRVFLFRCFLNCAVLLDVEGWFRASVGSSVSLYC